MGLPLARKVAVSASAVMWIAWYQNPAETTNEAANTSHGRRGSCCSFTLAF